MLPRHLHPRVRRIRREGDPAVGSVIAVESRRGGGAVLTLTVALPGGAETTVDRVVDADGIAVGDRVPMRYDRHRPERVEVDVQALKARPA